jgi:hypothetical protein
MLLFFSNCSSSSTFRASRLISETQSLSETLGGHSGMGHRNDQVFAFATVGATRNWLEGAGARSTIDLRPETFPCLPHRPNFFPQGFVPKHGFDAHDLKSKPLWMLQVGDNETVCGSCLLRTQLLLRIATILVAGLRQVVKLRPRTSKHYGNAVQACNQHSRHRPQSPSVSSQQSPPAFSRPRQLRREVCWCWHHSLRNLALRSSAAVPSC